MVADRADGQQVVALDRVAIQSKRHTGSQLADGDQIIARELYDLELDPQENNNVAIKTENLETIEQLASRLHAGWKAAAQ